MGDKAVTSENVPSIDNLRAHSPQIPGDSRPQPDTRKGLRSLGGTQIAVPAADPLPAPSRMTIASGTVSTVIGHPTWDSPVCP